MAVAIKHITDPVPHIRLTNPKLPEGMEAIIQKAMAKKREERFSTAVEMTNALLDVARGQTTQMRTTPALTGGAREVAMAAPTIKQSSSAVVPQKKGFNTLFVILPVIAIAAIAGGFLIFNGSRSPVATEQLVSTFTSAPPPTQTLAPTDQPTEVPVVIVEPTSTEVPPTPTETTVSALAALGGADKITFVANNEIWSVNVDGSELTQLTTDGGAKNDLQWLPDGETLIFISGLAVKSYNINTDVVDTLTSFPSATSLNLFRVSHNGEQAMIAMNNEIFVVPFDVDTMKGVSKKSDLLALEPCIVPEGKTRSALVVKEARWSSDDKLVAWLFKGPDASDQVGVLNIQDCTPATIDLIDTFPGTRFNPPGYQTRLMPDFDWDGFNQFIFNTSRRNGGWGELHIYNWETHKPTLTVNPIDKKCCYRDARWSPDGTYLLFAFQDEGLADRAQTLLYYVPFGGIGAGATINPIPLPDGFFKNPKEAPQPALRPAQ
jgi:hypothetical protein